MALKISQKGVVLTGRLDTKVLDRLVGKTDSERDKSLREIGFAVQGRAAAAAPVDTGSLASSIYTRTPDRAANPPPVQNSEAPRVQLPKPPKGWVYVGPSVEYGAYVEFGTKYMMAQPFLRPALNGVSDDLRKAAQKVAKPPAGMGAR